MSQHTIPAKPGFVVIAGYDRPLDNFFASVYDRHGEHIEWISGEPTVAVLAHQLRPYADVSSTMIATLLSERECGEVNTVIDDRVKHAFTPSASGCECGAPLCDVCELHKDSAMHTADESHDASH